MHIEGVSYGMARFGCHLNREKAVVEQHLLLTMELGILIIAPLGIRIWLPVASEWRLVYTHIVG